MKINFPCINVNIRTTTHTCMHARTIYVVIRSSIIHRIKDNDGSDNLCTNKDAKLNRLKLL